MGGLVSKLKKLFGQAAEESSDAANETGIHLPPEDEPIDVSFARNFSENALGFLYVQDEAELLEGMREVAKEFGLHQILAIDPKMKSILERSKLNWSAESESENDAILTPCEFLVAYNGAAVLCNKQTGGKRWGELPEMHIIVGYTHQLVPKMGDAMSGIRKQYGDDRPQGITGIGGITINSDKRSSLIPEEKGKKLFLFLVESSIH
jgi:L-lactate dehydrogenase complex protein LldG